MSALSTQPRVEGGPRKVKRVYLRLLEFSPLLALLLLATVWYGVPSELRVAMTRGGTWHASVGGLSLAEPPEPPPASNGSRGTAPALTRRRDVARSYYAGRRVVEWEAESPDRGFRSAARKVTDSLARRTEALFEPGGLPKPTAIQQDDPAYAPLRAWAASWDATPYAFLLPAPAEPAVVASVVARPEWLAGPKELASVGASDTPDYLWKVRNRGTHPTFLDLANWSEERFVRGSPRVLASEVHEIAGQHWLFVSMSPGGIWLEDPEGGYWQPGVRRDPWAISTVGKGTGPVSPEYQSALTALAKARNANVWVLGPLQLSVVPELVPQGVTVEQAAAFGQSVLRNGGSPGGGEVLDHRLAKLSPTERVLVPGSNYRVVAQLAGTSESVSESIPPQTMLYAATWATDPYPPLEVGVLSSLWDSSRAWFAAGQTGLLIVCLVLLGMTLVASPVSFAIDRRMTERERVAAEMERVQRDAHDRVYNRMAALSMRLEAESAATPDRESAAALAAVAADLADTRRDLREILGDARAVSAEHAAKATDPSAVLVDQMASLIAAQRSMTGVQIDLHIDSELPELAPEAGWDLQCIAEEAIANAIRHGHATRVSVSLTRDGTGVRLQVKDNGSPAEAIDLEGLPASSTGIRGMRARAERLGGSLGVHSADTGVTVVVCIPGRPSRGPR